MPTQTPPNDNKKDIIAFLSGKEIFKAQISEIPRVISNKPCKAQIITSRSMPNGFVKINMGTLAKSNKCKSAHTSVNI